MNKRGLELAVSTLIAIVLGILVLIALLYGFSIGWENFWNKITGYSGGKDNVQAVIQACTTACDVKNEYDYCTLKRDVIEEGKKRETTCNELKNNIYLDCEIVC
ncbi:hypothetical protein J4221_05030 [Candidatus Pacearchaeota archaeon]|nr:hypothetical protein [Candidatus Pacearchaeota archaeon]